MPSHNDFDFLPLSAFAPERAPRCALLHYYGDGKEEATWPAIARHRVGTTPGQAATAIAADRITSHKERSARIRPWLRLESFHTMAHNKELLDTAASLLSAPAMPQPGIRARVMFPSGIAKTTPPHQDWEQVYENWESDELQYYWKANELETVPMMPPTGYQ